MTALSIAIGALAPEVRTLVLRLADDSAHGVSRQMAHQSLAQLPIDARGGLTLRAGQVLVSDLAESVRRMRYERKRTGLRITDRTSPLAIGRAAFAFRLTVDVWERNRLRNRPHVVRAATRAVPPRPGRKDDWLVFLAEDGRPRYEARTFPPARGGSDQSTSVSHRLYVSRRWGTEVRQIGDGSGLVAGCVILSVRLIGRAEGTARRIFEAIVLRETASGALATEALYVSSWPRGESVHRTVGCALDDADPRDVASRLHADGSRKLGSKPFRPTLVLVA